MVVAKVTLSIRAVFTTEDSTKMDHDDFTDARLYTFKFKSRQLHLATSSAFLPIVGALRQCNHRFNSGTFKTEGSFPFRAALTSQFMDSSTEHSTPANVQSIC